MSDIKPISNPGLNISNSVSVEKNCSNNDKNFDLAKSTDIDKEEDEILYNELKALGFDFTTKSLEDHKKAIQAFPPLSAPGNVRRAYREALKNATPEEKKAARGMVFYMYIYKQQNDTDVSSNDVNGYLALMKDFKVFFTRYKDKLEGNNYNLVSNFLSKFTNELSKYKN